jgi:GNAT superfamily N-acetyltransferase
MFKLFQSIFGGGERKGTAYPRSLVEAAIDRALDATDPRIRAVSGHRKRLEPAVIHAIDYVVALVEGLSAPVEASAANYGADARLSSFFASTDRMSEVFGADRALIEFLASPEGVGTEPIVAVLFVERSEKRVLGMAVQGDQVMQEVSQVDYVNDLTLIAVVGEFGFGRVVAVGEYLLDRDSNFAEIAFSISRPFQRKGMGRILLRKLEAAAREHGISGFYAYTSAQNQGMIRLFTSLPYKVSTTFEGDMVTLRCAFSEPKR